jgi:exonuclease SbcC
MRILRLRFRNLNSLAGDWDIDFTHPAYVSSGIFAITGPTGAGKTTILDGICLALYGRTPRLKGITQSENEIMSRQTGDCFAEVEFETGKGRFRCHWSQHRSRKQADGQLQAPKHEIVDATSSAILESKLKAVAAKVEDVTGMDFDRFTRSMLLAQGGFDAFLQAAPDKRAPILEQITGTEIYSRISMKVHELTTEERGKLAEIRKELNEMQLLSPEEEESLRTELVDREGETTGLTAALQGLRDQKSWRERTMALESELVQIEQAWQSFEKKKTSAGPEIEQLERGKYALSLEGDYVNVAGIRKQQEAEQAELVNSRERLPKVQQALQVAADLLNKAEINLQKSRTEQAREAELIRRTRELDVKLGEARSRIQRLEDETEILKKQGNAYRETITKGKEQLGETSTALQAIDAFLEQHRADAGLVAALTGIEQQVRTFRLLGEQFAERRRQLDRQAAGCKEAEQAQQLAESAWQESTKTVALAEEQLGKVHAERETLLQGRELPAWRAEAAELVNRQNRLGNLQEAVARIQITSNRLSSLEQRMKSLEDSRHTISAQEESLTAECGLREEMVLQLLDKVVLLSRVRDLEAERAQLVDGAPCPLCGALEHPYASGNVPCADEAQQELDLARKKAKETNERLSGIKAELAGVTKEVEQAERDRIECLGILERDQTLCDTAAAELNLSIESETAANAISVEMESCREQSAKCRGVIDWVEQNLVKERGAKAAYDKARDELAARDKARHAADLGLETAVKELERLRRDCVALQDDLDRALAEVERAVEPYGYSEISPQNTEEMLVSLTSRRTAHGERQQEKEQLAQKLLDLGSELQKQQTLLAAAEINLAEREQHLAESLSQRAELTAQRQELFGDRNPDSEEKRLTDALREAGERRNAAWQEQNRLQAELAGLEEGILKLTASITARTEKLAELELALRRRLIDAGFADEAAFLQARLPQVRLDELSRLAENLRQEETEIQARRRDRTAALQQERDKDLTDKSLDQIQAESAAITMQLSELHKTLGAIGQKLQVHTEQQQLQLSRLQAVESQQKECARWDRLHELIGSSDGKKFRNFAQGLTFELMVAHANRQLQKMSDRYILERDSDEPLELNVIDNYQAGETRSTKNLSGGESFIVSLALALGLSNMASRNVRVDSLFLDEGFGTLDEDALETALETLSGLQQDGKLIGIISHVPALKERIGTQIQVEAGNSGRSSLTGPGCRRVA